MARKQLKTCGQIYSNLRPVNKKFQRDLCCNQECSDKSCHRASKEREQQLQSVTCKSSISSSLRVDCALY